MAGEDALAELTGLKRRLIILAVCSLGVSAVITQLALMREMLGAFCGNELVLGVILGNWLILMGLGSALGRTARRLKAPITVLVIALLLIAILPPLQVLAIRTLRNVVFTRGAMIGVVQTVVASLVLLAPYCLVSGYLLTLACHVLSAAWGSAGITRVYAADSIGSILGGAAFTFILVRWLDHVALLYVPAVVNLVLAACVAAAFNRKFLTGLAIAGSAGILALALTKNLDALSTALQYPTQEILFRGNSPYGRLIVTRLGNQVNFIENGVPIISTGNIAQVEEAVHYAMAQRPSAKKVLLISGGVSGTAQEILKYGVDSVTYVELDPLIIEAGRRFLPQSLDDSRIHVVNTDGRALIKAASQQYDVIILDLPDPSTSQINRYFTMEFFRDAKKRLAPNGVLALALGHYENRVSPELARMLASAGSTLKQSFANMLAIPGGRVFLLASDGQLNTDIAARIEHAGIPTSLVNRYYLDATLTPDRLAEVNQAAQQQAKVNKDFSPVLYYYHLLYWISQFKVSFGFLEALLIAALAIYLIRLRPLESAIFTSGFAASSLEIVLLLAVQVLCGMLYLQVGIVVVAFMAGLACGALASERIPPGASRKTLAGLAFGIAVFAGLLAPVLLLLGRASGGSTALSQAAVAGMTFVLAGLVGMEFPLAGRSAFTGGAATASRLYTADFVGACLGALLTATLLLPLLGVAATCILVGILNIVAGFSVLYRKL